MSTNQPPPESECAIREIENAFIPLADGTRLAARIWLPEGSGRTPVPAILEYLPYRKRDFMRARDEPMHRYYAARGYAALRVDIRGSGDSEGILRDEYTPEEQRDAVGVIEWIAAQSWCDGNVGMTGVSWGGFNALQVAARQPPALKAVITLCASDDRYADDAHYMGGCLLNENQVWGTALFGLNALPPDPLIVGDRWRQMWRDRLEANRPFPALWLEHPHRDDYWRQGSVCEDYGRIRCAVYAIGGWADGYSNAVPRLLEGLRCPRKGLVGPWAHTFPHNGVPGPAIGYLQEAVRWWDRWLKGVPNGIDREPQLRVWMQEADEPEPYPAERGGRWVAEAAWPSARIERRRLVLRARGGIGLLAAEPDSTAGDTEDTDVPLTLASAPTTGITAGVWCEFGSEGEAPRDQRADDARSLCFDGEVLGEDLEILGAPEVRLRLSADQPVALLAARLNEILPGGASVRVTYGVLNLTHREGHAHPVPLVPGEPVDVTLRLNHIAHRFRAGNTVRLAISSAYWPVVWPAPRPVTLTLASSGGYLDLPRRPPATADRTLAPFEPPEDGDRTSPQRALAPSRYRRTLERDLTSGQLTYRMLSEGGDLEAGSIARIDAIDLELGHHVERVFQIGETDPGTAETRVRERFLLRRRDWSVAVDASTRLTASETAFRVQAEITATEGGERVFERRWDETIPRKLL